MSLKTTDFDPAEYLTDRESITAYLNDAFENEDALGVVDALGDVVRARGGVERFAKESSVSAEVLASALKQTSPVDREAVMQVMHALGVRLSASQVA